MNAKKRFLFKWTNLLFAVLIALGGIFSVVSPGLAWAPSLNMNCIEIRASSGSFREKFYMDSQISKVSSEGPWVDLPRLWAKQRRERQMANQCHLTVPQRLHCQWAKYYLVESFVSRRRNERRTKRLCKFYLWKSSSASGKQAASMQSRWQPQRGR